jgi:hypothetical protein
MADFQDSGGCSAPGVQQGEKKKTQINKKAKGSLGHEIALHIRYAKMVMLRPEHDLPWEEQCRASLCST